MSQHDRLDAESAAPLLELLKVYPAGLNGIADIAERRAALRNMVAAAADDSDHRVAVNRYSIPAQDGHAAGALRSYTPENDAAEWPGLVYIHGGGMVMGDLDFEEATCISLCETLNIVVASIDYRKAPEHPYPAAPEDCYRALLWISEHVGELGIDGNNLGVYGGSAGGNLAIAMAMMARDRGGPALRFIMAPYPMLDHRNETVSSHEITSLGVWDRSANIEAWRWYLDGMRAEPYASPTLATDLGGLPPMFIDVGSEDVFRDESIDFAARLTAAGVLVEQHVYPGAYHGSEVMAPQAALSKQIVATRLAALRRLFSA